MRVALVHEFLTQLGGAEKVLQAFHELFPEAPVYTLVYDAQKTRGVFKNWDIRTSFLQKLPGMPKNYKRYLPLMIRATEGFDLRVYDLVLSDSSAFAKGVIVKKPTVHICYCHTPTRYLWESMDEYVASIPYSGVTKFLAKFYLKNFLKKWDKQAAQRPDSFVANSKTVQERIKKYYGRDSQVVYPPIDAQFFTPGGEKGNYFFTASRLEPYKKIDLVVEAFAELGWPLKVAGEGTDLPKLKSQYRDSKNIEFLGRVSDEELRKLYREASAFIFPALEDAGIMILESLACGTPVIGLAAGGAPEFIKDGRTGVLFASQTVADVVSAVKRFETLHFDSQVLRQEALEYDKENFKKRIQEVVTTHGPRITKL